VWNADEERECLSNPAGRGYVGSINVSASGKSCLPWTQVPTKLYYDLPDASTAEASNYCRYIPGQHWTGIYCAVQTKFDIRLERCNVPYCGSMNSVFLCNFEDGLFAFLAANTCARKVCAKLYCRTVRIISCFISSFCYF